MTLILNKFCRRLSEQIKQEYLFNLKREKSQRAKNPPIPKDKEHKFVSRKKQVLVTDTPEFWGLGLKESPTDNVWNRRFYAVPKYSLSEALSMHRSLAAPEMTDNMEGLVVLDAQLDLTTKKKTKFMGLVSGVVLLPHNYDKMIQGRVLAITKTDEDQRLALEAGAVYSGGLELIRKVERGDITADEYDCVVINPDLLLEASIIKRVLQDRFPSKKKGNLGSNIFEMVNLFTNGRQFESTKIADEVGRIVLPFGKLNLDDTVLCENLKAAVDAINLQKPNGKLISRLGVLCPPSKEIFYINDDKVLSTLDERPNKKELEISEIDSPDGDNVSEQELTAASV